MGLEITARILSQPNVEVSYNFWGTPRVVAIGPMGDLRSNLNELANRAYDLYLARNHASAMDCIVAEYLVGRVRELYTLVDAQIQNVNFITRFFIAIRKCISVFLAYSELPQIREIYEIDQIGRGGYIRVPRQLVARDPLLNQIAPQQEHGDYVHYSMEQGANILQGRYVVAQEERRYLERDVSLHEAGQRLERENQRLQLLQQNFEQLLQEIRLRNNASSPARDPSHESVEVPVAPPRENLRPKLPAFEYLIWNDMSPTREEIQKFFLENPGIDMRDLDHGGKTLLFRAMERPSPNQELISELLDRQAWYTVDHELISEQDLYSLMERHMNPGPIFRALFCQDQYREKVLAVLNTIATEKYETVSRDARTMINIARSILIDLHTDRIKSLGVELQNKCSDELWPVFSIIFSYMLPVLNHQELTILRERNEEAMKRKTHAPN